MMGNEHSQLAGLEIDEKPTEITDFWAHYQATITDSCRYFSLKSDGSVSVFKGEGAVGPLWTAITPLEKWSNNLLKYRHPCIVRYISSWQQRSIFHLATEYVQPLSQILCSQTPLQICIGLNNILRALVFLHEQAEMSHNNVSISAIYVTGDGQWKLGGLQYLCSFKDLTPSYLKQTQIHRYDNAVDPNEDSYKITTKVDQYAFAVLIQDVFKGHSDDNVPHLKEFNKYCKDYLRHENPNNRPALREVLQHNFFNHEFISIYKFLNFLPLKSEEERCNFFSTILENLKYYDEETIAKQLGGLLLSRLTMLDHTARTDVIPVILKPRHERSINEDNPGFFSVSVYKEHMKPRLMQLFNVRDSQIRMLLLKHFSKFVSVFSHDELSQQILPELLIGIKDTDDSLVASTLICLSELVPILGAHAVIGGKRTKLFTDGRPNSITNILITNSKKENQVIDSIIENSDDMYKENDSHIAQFTVLNERPSPVGGESIENDVVNEVIGGEEDWCDWDYTSRKTDETKSVALILEDTYDENIKNAHINYSDDNLLNLNEKPVVPLEKLTDSAQLFSAATKAKRNIVDISELDIKNQKSDYAKNRTDEVDFFADMMPVIEKAAVVSISEGDATQSSKLDFVPDEEVDENEGWEDNWND